MVIDDDPKGVKDLVCFFERWASADGLEMRRGATLEERGRIRDAMAELAVGTKSEAVSWM